MTEVVQLATAGHPVEAVELAFMYIATGQVDDKEMACALEACGRRLTVEELLVMYEQSTDARERQLIALVLDGELLPTPTQ